MTSMGTRGRPIEFDRDKAIEAAVEVFWCKGYEATSMADLLEAMGLSKSSIYQSFGSKQRLFELCLDCYAERLAANMAKILDEAKSGRGFIEDLFTSIANTAQQPEGAKGCLMVNSVSEFGQRDSSITVSLDSNLSRFTELFAQAIRRAQAEGDIAPEADVGTIATYLHVALSGLRTMIKAGIDRNSTKNTVKLILKAVE